MINRNRGEEMYEIRQQQRKQMREHKFFYHFILAMGIFVFSQGCSLMSRKPGYASSALILGIILHNASVEKIFISIFKNAAHKNAKIAMIIILLVIALFSYFKRLGFTIFVLLDLASIIVFTVIALIYSKSKKQQE
ncbi:MAG: hypothetical protein GX289_07815 [Tissierellia bacterium]|nr:hypothetical protein [Tissierellia bacterium]